MTSKRFSLPEYSGKTPTRNATVTKTYTFAGWTPSLAAVTKAATYTATYDSTDITYAVTFANYDGTKLQVDNMLYGTTPKYTGTTPSRKTTAQYTYTFKEWAPSLTNVTGNVTYTAVFDSSVNKYLIAFIDYDGSILQKDSLVFGATPTYAKSIATRDSSAGYTYRFIHWTPSISSVTNDASYKAVYDSTIRYYKVVFKNGDKTIQTSTQSYGSVPVYLGRTPTKTSTAEYDYVFVGWDTKIKAVSDTATYSAVFDSTYRVSNPTTSTIPLFNLFVAGRDVQIAGAKIESTFAVFDMQGRIIIAPRTVTQANFNITLPQAGSYLVRIGLRTMRVNVN